MPNKGDIKQFQTKSEEERKIEKELQNMYLILVNTKFMSDIDTEDTQGKINLEIFLLVLKFKYQLRVNLTFVQAINIITK